MLAIGLIGNSFVATGVVVGPPQAPTVIVEGKPVSVENDKVASHGAPPCTAAILTKPSCSKTVFANKKQVVVVGLTTSSCGHPVSTGASTVFVGP